MNAAIYIRKSREDANKAAHRLTAQREQLPAHARAQGWAPKIYDDGHASAARGKTEDLTERSRLEADIVQGNINVILCIELSRLSRDESMQDYVAWLHLCSEHGVKLATPSRVLDPAQPSDWMLLLLEGGFSSVEMKILQKRMAEGRLAAIRAGRYIAGNPPPPYLYDKAIGGLVVDEAMNQKMQKLFTMAENSTIREMSKVSGLPNISVRRALSEDRLLMYQGLRRDPVTRETIEGEWPAVITAEQASKILLLRPSLPRSASRRKAAGLLSNLKGVTKCGFCNENTRGVVNSYKRSDGTKLSYYACQAKDLNRTCTQARMIPQHIIDDRVIGNLLGTLKQIDEHRQRWVDSQDTDAFSVLDQLEKQEEKLLSQKKRLIAAVAEGVIEFADAKEKRLELERDLLRVAVEIKGQREAANNEEPPWDDLQLTFEEFDVLDFEMKREIILAAIKSIRIFASYMIIEYRFPIDKKSSTTKRVHIPPKSRPGPRSKKQQKTT